MLQAHLSSKVATLVEEVFRRAGYGVLKNTSFTVETVLVFVYKLLNNTVAQQTRCVTASQPDHIGNVHMHSTSMSGRIKFGGVVYQFCQWLAVKNVLLIFSSSDPNQVLWCLVQ